MLAVTFNNL